MWWQHVTSRVQVGHPVLSLAVPMVQPRSTTIRVSGDVPRRERARSVSDYKCLALSVTQGQIFRLNSEWCCLVAQISRDAESLDAEREAGLRQLEQFPRQPIGRAGRTVRSGKCPLQMGVLPSKMLIGRLA